MTSPPDLSHNPFFILGISPSPWVDPVELEARYDALCREAATTSVIDTQALHQARTELARPSRRLHHLLEFLGREKQRGSVIEPDLLALFQEMGPLMAAADDGSRKLATAQSELAKAILFPKIILLQKQLTSLRENLDSLLAELDSQLQLLALGPWQEQGDRLQQLQTRAGFLEKWIQQAQQKWMSLVPG
jgi:hypothetical protein